MIVAYEELLELVRSYPNSTKYEYVHDCQYTGLNGTKYSSDTSTGTASTSYVYAYLCCVKPTRRRSSYGMRRCYGVLPSGDYYYSG